MSLAVIALVGFSFYFAACSSPETTRTRGGGPGADVGNRDKFVQMHEGSPLPDPESIHQASTFSSRQRMAKLKMTAVASPCRS
jgi:hypothetical protein